MGVLKNIATIICVSCLLILHPSFNKGDNFITRIQHSIYGNTFTIVNSGADINDIKVIWKSKEKSDSKDLLIYAFGKNFNDIPSVSGKQTLEVMYKNKLVGKVEQNKPVSTQSHKYIINLSTKNGAIFFKGEIKGPSSSKTPSVTIPNIASL
ncbi:MAG: hypothetical protein IT232_06360 [Flavobacteriales bacterium]|nr:hypothetical protein [Flavobacteriales bacterium]